MRILSTFIFLCYIWCFWTVTSLALVRRTPEIQTPLEHIIIQFVLFDKQYSLILTATSIPSNTAVAVLYVIYWNFYQFFLQWALLVTVQDRIDLYVCYSPTLNHKHMCQLETEKLHISDQLHWFFPSTKHPGKRSICAGKRDHHWFRKRPVLSQTPMWTNAVLFSFQLQTKSILYET